MNENRKEIIKSVFNFDNMLTPKIITFVYWLLLLSTFGTGLMILFSGKILSTLAVWVIGGIGVRIWCELLIVLFKINGNLQKMADREQTQEVV